MNTIEKLLTENKSLKERVEYLEDMLEFSPQGDTIIDQLEETIKYKDDEIARLKKQNIELSNAWLNQNKI